MTYHQADDERANWYRNQGHRQAGEAISRAASQHQPQHQPRPQSNFQPFVMPQQTSQPQYVTQPSYQPSRPTQNSYYAGEGTQAVMKAKARAEGVLLAWLGYKVSLNSYALSADWAQAVVHGLHAVRRWWIWLFCTQVWLLSAGFVVMMMLQRNGGFIESGDSTASYYILNGKIFTPIAFVLGVLVPYCRVVDYSLFKRRLVYKVMQPVCKLVEWVPNFWLYTLCFWVPLFGWIQWG